MFKYTNKIRTHIVQKSEKFCTRESERNIEINSPILFLSAKINYSFFSILKMHISWINTYRAIVAWVRGEHHVYHVSAVARFPDWFAFALWLPQTGSTPLFISSFVTTYFLHQKKNIIEITNTDRYLTRQFELI